MLDAPSLLKLQVGDRVQFIYGIMHGHRATVAKIGPEGYWLLGDWTSQTGFTRVLYGPVEPDYLQRVA